MAFSVTLKMTLIGLGLIMSTCVAVMIEKETMFVDKKSVKTSHTTLENYSKIKCVRKCHEESTKGLCSVAGYNKATKTCHLSIDNHHDVLDVCDEMSGVFFMSPYQGWVNLRTLKKYVMMFDA